MTTIVLLDSDSNALDALVSAVLELKEDWVVHGINTGAQALKLASQEDIDIIITETNLCDTTGFELLNNVRVAHENIIRFTLTADLESEIVLESARVNHRFIAKPVTLVQLIANIEGSLELRDSLTQKPLLAMTDNIKSIPVLPVVYNEMMRELASAHSSLLRVGEIIESDTGLTITVLKIVNSAFYGLNQRVESVGQAVALLGVHLIKNITLTAKVFSKFEGSQISLKRLTELNEQAIATGALANQFARHAKLSKGIVDHCQLTGMLCNVGELIATTKLDSDDAEHTQISSSLLGAYILRSWTMPDAIIEAIALQHEPSSTHISAISPTVILQSIRYLQRQHTDVTDTEQRQQCLEHLLSFTNSDMAEAWLNDFQALSQLTESASQQAA